MTDSNNSSEGEGEFSDGTVVVKDDSEVFDNYSSQQGENKVLYKRILDKMHFDGHDPLL